MTSRFANRSCADFSSVRLPNTGAPSFALGADQSSEVTAARLALSSLGSYLGDRAAGGLFDVVQFQTSGLESDDTRNLRSAGAGILAGTRLDLGKQLSDRVFVTANAGLCQFGNVVGGSSFNAQDFAESIGIKVDYRLGSGLSLSAGVEPPTGPGRGRGAGIGIGVIGRLRKKDASISACPAA